MSPSPRRRADLLLVARGLFDSRAKAQAAIAAGRVTVDGITVRKPSEALALDAAIAAEPAFPWVSRGGIKLAHALDRLGLDVTDRVCLDVGASTGGFTEVLLARGARRVFAVDVGRDQLHATLRGRPQIVSIEETDIRNVEPARLGAAPDLATIDVSFISLRQVLPAVLALAAARARLIALIKPQFEVGDRKSGLPDLRTHKRDAGKPGFRRALKKGIVRDPAVHAAVCAEIADTVTSLGWQVDATFASPIAGGDGNREFLIGAHRG